MQRSNQVLLALASKVFCFWCIQMLLLDEAVTSAYTNVTCTGMRCCSLECVLDAACKLQGVVEQSMQYLLGPATLHFCTV